MVAFPNVDGITSALSLILVAMASLRAASRLERRIDGGSIGLMDGPPIPGPGDDDGETGDGGTAVGASPLWEHAEAFRRAAILGLIFDNINDDDGGDCSDIFAAFSDVVRREGRSGHVAGYRTDVLQQANIADHGILLSVRTRRRRRQARGASAVVRSIDGRRVVGDDQRS